MIPRATAYETDVGVLRNRVNALRVENDRLKEIEIAARNLVAQKGRHNTQIAYERLEALLKTPNAMLIGGGTPSDAAIS